MVTLTVTTKGQITLKKDVLRHLGVAPGQRVVVETLPGGKASISAETRRAGSIEDIFGILKNPDGPHLTIEDINEEIAKAWASRSEDRG